MNEQYMSDLKDGTVIVCSNNGKCFSFPFKDVSITMDSYIAFDQHTDKSMLCIKEEHVLYIETESVKYDI